jgi:hypothetical protein
LRQSRSRRLRLRSVKLRSSTYPQLSQSLMRRVNSRTRRISSCRRPNQLLVRKSRNSRIPSHPHPTRLLTRNLRVMKLWSSSLQNSAHRYFQPSTLSNRPHFPKVSQIHQYPLFSIILRDNNKLTIAKAVTDALVRAQTAPYLPTTTTPSLSPSSKAWKKLNPYCSSSTLIPTKVRPLLRRSRTSKVSNPTVFASFTSGECPTAPGPLTHNSANSSVRRIRCRAICHPS